jgi:hypothetical protein
MIKNDFKQILGLYISNFVLKMNGMIDPSLKGAALFSQEERRVRI